MKNSLNRQIGSIFMIIGTEIGAGVLALPIIISHLGVLFGSVVLIIAWALMLYTALLICEASSTLTSGVSFASLASKFLGQKGKLLLSIFFLATLLSIIMAYISAAGSTFHNILDLSPSLTAIIFVCLFGICVIIGTKMVDYVNRILLSINLLAFLIAILLLLNTITPHNLLAKGEVKNIITTFPAIITVFILHNIIPTIRSYLHNNQKILRRVIIIGSVIPLALYLLWIIAIIGNIPHHGTNSFDFLYAKGSNANVGDLLLVLSHNTNNNLITSAINLVATISVTTAFLGTSISLYHFSQDLLGHKTNSLTHYIIIPILITFVLPLLIVLFKPDIFILALSYAGVGATIIFVLIPILIIKQMNKQSYQFSQPGLKNKFLLNLFFILGLSIIFIRLSF